MVSEPTNQIITKQENTFIDVMKDSVVDIDAPPMRQDWNTCIDGALLAVSDKSNDDVSSPDISSHNMSPKK